MTVSSCQVVYGILAMGTHNCSFIYRLAKNDEGKVVTRREFDNMVKKKNYSANLRYFTNDHTKKCSFRFEGRYLMETQFSEAFSL